MKRRIWNSIGMTVLAAAIAFSLAQLRTQVVKADGCPAASSVPQSVGCNCVYDYGLWSIENGVPHGECHYTCQCCDCWPNADVNNFLIERTYDYYY